MGKMRKEEELISLISRVTLDENETRSAEDLLQEDLDWEHIFKRSEEEGLSPLIYHHFKLKNLKGSDYIPESILEHAKEAYYNNSLNNMLLCEECKKVLKIFSSEKISAMILKGIYLAENIYKNIALRPIADMDILIKREDLPKTNEILRSLGYIVPSNYADFLLKKETTPINSLVYNKPGVYFFLHLHWHIINLTWPLDSVIGMIDMDRIWSSAEPTMIDGVECLSLSPHHLLIYLAHHGFSHCFNRLILASDIFEFLRCNQDTLDWDLVIKEAERLNLSLVLYYSLCFSSYQLRSKIPMLEKLKPAKFGFLEELLLLFLSKGKRWRELYYFTYFLGEKGILPKIGFIKKTLFPSAYVMAQSLNIGQDEINVRSYYTRIINNFLP